MSEVGAADWPLSLWLEGVSLLGLQALRRLALRRATAVQVSDRLASCLVSVFLNAFPNECLRGIQRISLFDGCKPGILILLRFL